MNENTNLTNHTVAVYDSHDQAETAVKELRDAGYDLKNLSIVGQNYQTEARPVGFVNAGDRMLSWGSLGAFWGSIWGLLFGSAMLFVPGIGHVMFAGWLVAALEGALLGGGIGVLGGALASIGIPANSVVEYETALKAGSFLLIAHGSEEEVARAKTLLTATPAARVDTYSTDKSSQHHAGCH